MSAYEDLAELVRFRPLERPIRSDMRRSQFSAPWTHTIRDLATELKALAPREAILQVDLREQDFRQDGLPRANRSAYSPGVVLSLVKTRHGHDLRYEVGTYDDWRDNVRAIALGLRSLRAVDRYGITRSGEQYAGWKQLASGSEEPSADRGQKLVERHGGIRAAEKATHPDLGGNAKEFADVQAYKELVAA